MLDYSAAIGTESARLLEVVKDLDGSAPVPSCPEWSVADLTWHIAEVQSSWAQIVGGLLGGFEEVVHPQRPPDGDLPALLREQTALLLAALDSRADSDECWSWHPEGQNVGWVKRRQAHEALIHRADAELAAEITPVADEILALDGVDEILCVMMDSSDLPEWAVFERLGAAAMITAETRSWALDLGHFRGTSPVSGNTYDFPAVQVVEPATDPAVLISGSGSALDLWLWGRGPLGSLEIEGDAALADFVRRAAVESTQ